jgi:hypothetical protein
MKKTVAAAAAGSLLAGALLAGIGAATPALARGWARSPGRFPPASSRPAWS